MHLALTDRLVLCLKRCSTGRWETSTSCAGGSNYCSCCVICVSTVNAAVNVWVLVCAASSCLKPRAAGYVIVLHHVHPGYLRLLPIPYVVFCLPLSQALVYDQQLDLSPFMAKMCHVCFHCRLVCGCLRCWCMICEQLS
jgi:hypothetical protein